MKKTIALFPCLLLLTTFISVTAQERKVILEVTATVAGNKLYFYEKNSYLTVYADGSIEYSDRSGNKDEVIHRTAKLSDDALQSLIEFLSKQEVKNLESGQYPSYPPNLKFFTSIEISINRDNQIQTVGTHNFKMPLGGINGRKLPEALIELICRVESLRKSAILKVTPDGYCIR
jgi:hypothetical protein